MVERWWNARWYAGICIKRNVRAVRRYVACVRGGGINQAVRGGINDRERNAGMAGVRVGVHSNNVVRVRAYCVQKYGVNAAGKWQKCKAKWCQMWWQKWQKGKE